MSTPRFITLGPAGHLRRERAAHYLEFQGLVEFEIDLVPDLLEAVDLSRILR